MREIVGQLQLPRLTLHQFGIGGRKQTNGFLAEMGGGDLRRPRHEEIPCEDGDRVGPIGVSRAGTTTRVGLVNHVIVIERPDVDQFHRYTGFDGPSIVGRAELGRE